MPALNKVQLEILKLFRNDQSEEELQEIRSLLVVYLSDKVTMDADEAFRGQAYAVSIFEKWKQEHFRKSI